MGSALLFILRSRLLAYSAGSGMNRMQVVLSGFRMRLFCFVQAKTVCGSGCIYVVLSRQTLYVGLVVCISWLHSCLCVYVMVMSSAYAMT